MALGRMMPLTEMSVMKDIPLHATKTGREMAGGSEMTNDELHVMKTHLEIAMGMEMANAKLRAMETHGEMADVELRAMD